MHTAVSHAHTSGEKLQSKQSSTWQMIVNEAAVSTWTQVLLNVLFCVKCSHCILCSCMFPFKIKALKSRAFLWCFIMPFLFVSAISTAYLSIGYKYMISFSKKFVMQKCYKCVLVLQTKKIHTQELTFRLEIKCSFYLLIVIMTSAWSENRLWPYLWFF